MVQGTGLLDLGRPDPFRIETDVVGLKFQDPALAAPSFINAAGHGTKGRRNLP